MSNQASLFTPSQLEPPAIKPNSTVQESDRVRLGRSCKAILRMLRAGPRSNMELMAGGGGVRYSARIGELRAAGIEIETKHVSGGEYTYKLINDVPEIEA